MTCLMESIYETRENGRWSTILRKARENVDYVEAFKKYLDNPVTLDKALRGRKEAIDHARSYDELKILRELAVFKLKRERGLSQTKEEKTRSSELWSTRLTSSPTRISFLPS